MTIFNTEQRAVIVAGRGEVTIVLSKGGKFNLLRRGAVDWSRQQNAAGEIEPLIFPRGRRDIGQLCLILPQALFFSKIVHLPSVDEQEIRNMIRLRIGEYLPYGEEQAVWDIMVIGQKGPASDVLLISIQREKLLKYLHCLSAAGLSPQIVTNSACGWTSVLSWISPGDHHVLVAAGDHTTEFCFSSMGKSYFSREILFGIKDLETEDRERYLTQIRLTFEAQRKSFLTFGSYAGFFVRSDGQDIPPILAQEITKTSDKMLSPVGEEEVKKIPGGPALFKTSGFSADALAAVAVARRGFEGLCNLLPEDFKQRQIDRSDRRDIIIVSVLSFLAMASLTLAVAAPLAIKMDRLRYLRKELMDIKKPSQMVRRDKQLWTTLQNTLKEHVSPLRIIDGLYKAVPQGVAFTRVRLSEQNELTLEGYAYQSSAENDLQEKMISTGLFEDVRLEHSMRRAGASGEVVQFIMTAKLRKGS